ncbi:MAG: hypothetical protein QOH09_4558, partial [Pseudonocardiales bacterium]|nr:hypothetical protein [Pseudonocardiales bacterium]
PEFAVVAGHLAAGGGVIIFNLAPFLDKGSATKVDEKSLSTASGP